jgi:DNA polymerase-3 subunit beta
MNFGIQREALLKPLQTVCGVVERRQTLPILSHILLKTGNGLLSMTGTDLEVEMVASTELKDAPDGEITLPARKFLDICKTLPENSKIELKIEGEKAIIRAGRSRFTLATLPAEDFPNVDSVSDGIVFSIPQNDLKFLIDHTAFAMAQQDVRYYLNGLMLELTTDQLRAVATDGHRLAMCDTRASIVINELRQVILPRKAVMELSRLLAADDALVEIKLGTNHISLRVGDLVFTSKLIDGRFPDYQRVFPKGCDKILIAEKNILKQSLTRASILSNEKYRGIRLVLATNVLKILANNPEQEEAEEEIEVNYTSPELEIGFNVNYLMDALGAVDADNVKIAFSDSNSSCLVTPENNNDCCYVVMPMRL